jgi:hypothetical protein
MFENHPDPLQCQVRSLREAKDLKVHQPRKHNIIWKPIVREGEMPSVIDKNVNVTTIFDP